MACGKYNFTKRYTCKNYHTIERLYQLYLETLAEYERQNEVDRILNDSLEGVTIALSLRNEAPTFKRYVNTTTYRHPIRKTICIFGNLFCDGSYKKEKKT